MNRQEKYPDTETFHWYNANPKGKITTDCTVRAICTGLKLPYRTVVMEMAELQCKTGYDCDENRLINKYLESKGWEKISQPKKHDNTKYTGEEFCKDIVQKYLLRPYSEYDHIIANMGSHHIVAIVNGRVWDTWDSTDGKVGIYWVKR